MEWLSKMNAAIDYIEEHLEGKIDLNAVARIACCSLSRFQRMFTFAVDIPVTEYIRGRKLSVAAYELLNSDVKVIDLSLKYGYESPAAFTRAYQAFHGVSPTSTRKLGIYTNYPRLSFQIVMNGGNFSMGTKPIVRIEEHNNEKVISFKVDCRGPEEAAGNLLKDWVVKNIKDYAARRYIGCAPKGHHPDGEEHHPDEEMGEHEYIFHMFLFDHEADSAFCSRSEVSEAPKGLYLIGDVALDEYNDAGNIDVGSSMQTAYGVMKECLEEMGGYEFDLQERPYYEEHIFHTEWFTGQLVGDSGLAGFKLWLPIRRTS